MEDQRRRTVETAFEAGVGVLRELFKLKEIADEDRNVHVENHFEQFRVHLRDLFQDLENQRIADCFLRSRSTVDKVQDDQEEMRSWHHVVLAIGIHWYQQIFREVNSQRFLHTRANQPWGFRFDEYTAEEVAIAWKAFENFDYDRLDKNYMIRFRMDEVNPLGKVCSKLRKTHLPDIDLLFMQLDIERAHALREWELSNPEIPTETPAETETVEEISQANRDWPDPSKNTRGKVWTLKTGVLKLRTYTDGIDDGAVEFGMANGQPNLQAQLMRLLCFANPNSVTLLVVMQQIYPEEFQASLKSGNFQKLLSKVRGLISDIRIKKLLKAGLNPEILPPLTIDSNQQSEVQLQLRSLEVLDNAKLDDADKSPFA